MKVDLRSDTVTKPSKEMLNCMIAAEVGDDVLGDDPTVTALEDKLAHLFNKEAAVFCSSGTMCNQIALQMHTGRLDEVVCHANSHINLYETAGYAHNAGIGIKTIDNPAGKIQALDIESAIYPDYDWLPRTRLVILENSCNRSGGIIHTLDEMKAMSDVCRKNNLKLHMDGARVFNALASSKLKPADVGPLFDSISICLSKGLGAPVGSVLLGTKADIHQARKYRKVMGGGMRQAGYLAAAGIYALDNNVKRLSIDHERALRIAGTLSELPFIKNIRPVMTNIVIAELNDKKSAADFANELADKNIHVIPMGAGIIRFVTHLDINDEMIEHTIKTLAAYK